jgi:L-lactate dehydrogenase complex protein LldG
VTTKADFLDRIRAEMARTRGLTPREPALRPARPRERLDVLRRELSERWRDNLDRFAREFERVGGVLHRVGEAREVPDVVARIAAERTMRRVVAWPGATLGVDVAAPLAARGLEAAVMPGAEVGPAERERLRALAAAADLGVTGADVAIAETGTLVVVSGAGRPRSTSLLPACHVAVFDREILVESLLQMGLVLEAWHEGPEVSEASWRGAAINFITGPSRTADIELTLTRGVHGPKEVHAVFVERGLAVAQRA